MAKTKSMTGNQNHDDDSSSSISRKRSKTFENGGGATWSDRHRHALFLVMLRLGFIDFFAFSAVCKSWRSLALSDRDIYMASIPPMSIRYPSNNQDSYWYLKDFEGKKFKTEIPHSAGRTCFGLTCGYLILFSRETRDFWLVNLITRHELHFPDYPISLGDHSKGIGVKAILVFSPSISGWVLVVLHRTMSLYKKGKRKLSFSIAGKRGWNHVSSTHPIIDLLAFKGKIYILHLDCNLGELRLDLNRKRKGTLLETKIIPPPDLFRPEFLFCPELVSSGEKLYVISHYSSPPQNVRELNFDEMKWLSPKKTIGEYAFFITGYNYSAAIKTKSWAGTRTQYKSYDFFLNPDRRHPMFNFEAMWFFPHDCLNANILDE